MTKLGKLTPEQIERGKRFARKAQTPGQAFITFGNGFFIMNSQEVNGSVYIAAVDETSNVWKLFLEGGVADIQRFNVFTHKDPPRPDSHTDRDQWKIDEKTKDNPKPRRMDPWSKSMELLLLRLGEDGQPDGVIVILQATTAPLRTAIGVLTDRFIADGGKKRYFIKLTANEETKLPKLEVLGESDDTTEIYFYEDGTISTSKTGDLLVQPLDDDIPF